MRSPAYDWDWFEKHTPFKKIFEEYCDLVINKELIPYRVFGNIWNSRTHFNIELNYHKTLENFAEMKNKLLNTRICKHNQEIFDYVNEKENTMRDISTLIIDGCLSCKSASFSWNWIE